MPLVRAPGSIHHTQVTTVSTANSGSAASSLATTWNVPSHEKQLEEMKAEAPSGSSMISSPAAVSPFDPFQKYVPTPTRGSTHPPSKKEELPPAMSSRKAMKQRLFQMSDTEDDDGDQDLSAEDGHAPMVQRKRIDRTDNMRRSFSATSGVTVIGRGSTSIHREGSTSTLGSRSSRSNGSTDYGRPARNSIDEMPEPDAPFAPKVGDRMDLPAALSLLSSYPRSTSPARNRPDEHGEGTHTARPTLGDDRAKPPLARSVSAYTGSASPDSFVPTSSQPPLIPSPTRHRSPSPSTSMSGSTSLSRRHSRSGVHERATSPFAMSPILSTDPRNGQYPPLVSPTYPEPLANYQLASTSGYTSPLTSSHGRRSPGVGKSPSFNGYSLSATASPDSGRYQHVAPQRSASRRSSRASEHEASGSTVGGPSSSSRSVSTSDLSQIMRSFSQRPRRALSRQNTQDNVYALAEGQNGSENPLRRSQRSGNASQADLKLMIQQKRRQASAPFYTTASVAPSTSTSPVLGSGAQSPVIQLPESMPAKPSWEVTPPRRARSRHSTTAGVGGLLALSLSATGGFEEARLRAMRGMGEVVMTPSVEEWRQLGLNENLNDREDASSSGSDTDESDQAVSDTDDMRDGGGVDVTPRPRVGSIRSMNQFYGAIPPPAPDFALHLDVHDGSHTTPSSMKSSHTAPSLSRSGTNTSVRKSPKARNIRDLDMSSDFSANETDESADLENEMERRLSQRTSIGIPTLSRQSLSAPTGTPTPGSSSAHASTPLADNAHALTLANGLTVTPIPASNGDSSLVSLSPSRASSPVPLSMSGPIDPRAYSAVTGLRSVNSFIVQGEAGKGAYGLVRKVREKGPDGKAVGPSLMLKYIVKQRILADAYKRHKVLGAIPMEIHVLDFIRRVQRSSPYPAARDPLSAVSAFRYLVSSNAHAKEGPAPAPTSASEVAQQTTFGHPALCQMLDFFEDAENYYLVMSCFGEGQDLFDYVDAAPEGLGLEESRLILKQIVDGIAFLHSHGIVHRDIKDENIILDGKGGVQLIDFGSAAYIKEGKPYFDTFSGTLDFASPEVLRGERYGGKETDIWALGVLGYVVLCGECPFWSSDESVAGLTPGSRAEEALQAKYEKSGVHLPTAERAIFMMKSQDAIDVVHQCLAVHARDRPSAVLLQTHRFFVGEGGWVGRRGWELVEEHDESSSSE